VAAVICGEGPVPPRRELLFTFVIEFLGDLRTSFANQWSETDAVALMAHLRAAEAARSLSWWVRREATLTRMRTHHAQSKARYVAELTERIEGGRSHLMNADGSDRRQLLLPLTTIRIAGRHQWERLLASWSSRVRRCARRSSRPSSPFASSRPRSGSSRRRIPGSRSGARAGRWRPLWSSDS
jgi:hypothetical protein